MESVLSSIMNPTQEPLSLLILAAGMGSRYGGLKQLEGFGPNGETLMEYSLYHARAAGFRRFVFVIRRDFADAFQSAVLDRLPKDLEVVTVFQELDCLPEGVHLPLGRTKPWGTGHAVWVARDLLRGPFGVINADDYYGPGAMRELAEFLRDETEDASVAVIAFELGQTLSEHGGVSRGIVCGEEGRLLGLHEYHGLVRVGDDVEGTPEGGEDSVVLPPTTAVSMNLFGFRANAVVGLDEAIRQFFDQEILSPKCEYYLPVYVDGLREAGSPVAVRLTDEAWIGVTFGEDRDRVAAAVAERIERGDLPGRLI